jgi:CRISPR-associated protein Cas1
MKKTYYLFNPGRLQRKDNTLKFTPYDEEGSEKDPRYLPVENVGDLYCFGNLDANSALYNFLGQHQIPIHFFDYHENYTGSFLPRESLISGKMLIHQVKAQQNKQMRITLAKRIVEGASYNMLKNLSYYKNRGKEIEPIIETMKSLTCKIGISTTIEELMGMEGNIRKNYYESFELIISDFSMNGRSYRPPRNEVNALISFGNMMCYSQCLRAIHQTQLHPAVSFLHEPGERRFSLSLDIAEIFKPLLVDRVLFKVLNKKMIQRNHFEVKLNSVILKEAGRKIFVQAFEDRLNETIKHRTLSRSVSYKHLIKLECYKIQKHLLGIEEYVPFKMWW